MQGLKFRIAVKIACRTGPAETLDGIADFQEIHETYVGCTVACHCGPGTLGVLFITK